MTKEEFLLDMLDYYTVDPEGRRCRNDTGCFYSPETVGKATSEGCAIGRKLSRELANEIDKEGIAYPIKDVLTIEDYQAELPQWMFDLPTGVLQDCQNLHDDSSNWIESGLSDTGRNTVSKIISEYDLDKSKFEKYL